jgi:hypothetical protein
MSDRHFLNEEIKQEEAAPEENHPREEFLQ